MKKVITYGTYDLLHYGHIRLLERAKSLGDYLIVGVTADDFDKTRGKINVQQSLIERIEAVKATGLADEIIVEEYEGQKIDDIKRLGVDIFTVGDDWVGVFDYLNDYCQVVYLDRTKGVSSSELRCENIDTSIGLIGKGTIIEKYWKECSFVNGINLKGIYSCDDKTLDKARLDNINIFGCIDDLLNSVDAVYIIDAPRKQYDLIKQALLCGKHVLCEAPMVLSTSQIDELFELAKSKNLIFMEALKTAYSTAFNRLQLLVKSGKIGNVVSIDATCTSMRNLENLSDIDLENKWNSMYAWGPTSLLPIFNILGTDYSDCKIISKFADKNCKYDVFSKINFIYKNAVASIKVGQGVKSEGELIISGTEGYIYVPAPWWKTEYFEIRYEDISNNKRYFYQLDGEGIRYELVAFVKNIQAKKEIYYIDKDIIREISHIMEIFENGNIVKIV